MSLYKSTDPVIRLTMSDFEPARRGSPLRLKTKSYKGAGFIKAYAPWCPHCVSKVKDINTIASILNRKSSGTRVYVLNADGLGPLGVGSNGEPLVEAFPTMLSVAPDRTIDHLVDANGKPAFTVPEALGALCQGDRCSQQRWYQIATSIATDQIGQLTSAQLNQLKGRLDL